MPRCDIFHQTATFCSVLKLLCASPWSLKKACQPIHVLRLKREDKGLKSEPCDVQLPFCPCSLFNSHNQKNLVILKFCLIPSQIATWHHHITLLFTVPGDPAIPGDIMASRKSSSSLATFAHLALFWGLGRSICAQSCLSSPKTRWDRHEHKKVWGLQRLPEFSQETGRGQQLPHCVLDAGINFTGLFYPSDNQSRATGVHEGQGRMASDEVNSKISNDFSGRKIETMFPVRAIILRNCEGNF